MYYHDLLDYLKNLENIGLLYKIQAEVDKNWELSCVARLAFQGLPDKGKKGLLFENIAGYETSVAVGVLGASREVYAAAVGVSKTEDIKSAWIKGLETPIPPKVVSANQASVQERVMEGRDVDLSLLPVPLWTPEKDGGNYLSSPIVITKDPDTGIQNCGTYRCMIKPPDKIGIGLLHDKHIGIHYRKYEALNERMPVAIAIGGDPSIGLTAVAHIPYGVDELTVSGGIRGKAVEVVPAKTVDLLVPAHAEFVIEGFIEPLYREHEGPFGEWMGTMGVEKRRPVIKVTCITSKKKPIFQGYLSQMPPSESSLIRGEAFAAIMYKYIALDIGIPGIKDIYFPEAGGGGGHAIIQISPQYNGHPRQVGLAVLGCNAVVPKIVTIVNEDIDIRDPFILNWASTFRVNPVKDVLIIPDCPISQLDPSVRDIGTTDTSDERGPLGSKMIIDATKGTSFPSISLPPTKYIDKCLNQWSKYMLPEVTEQQSYRLLGK